MRTTKTLIYSALTLATSWIGHVGAVNDDIYYLIGGGEPIARPASNRAQTFDVGAGVEWGSDLMCGNFDMGLSVQSQLNGLEGAFNDLMGDVIEAATGVVASLPAMIIQKVNPALYDLLQNGVLQASEEYHIAVKSCEEIVKDIQGQVEGNGWKSLARAGYWKEQSQIEDKEILAVKSDTDTVGLNRGVPWVAGALRGGQAQPPIEVIGDTAKAGYNLLLNRDPDNSMAMDGTCDEAALCETWASPQAHSDWLVEVLGEHKVRTCQGCDPLATRAGMGLAKAFEHEQTRIRAALTELAASATVPTADELSSVSGGKALTVSRRVIEAIREEEPEEQGPIIERLAGEMAMSVVMEQALMARRTLLSGMKEPNIANVEIAQTQLQEAVDELDTEMDNLLFELDVRKRLAGNTPYLLLQRQRTRSSVPLIEGYPDNRLQDGAVRK